MEELDKKYWENRYKLKDTGWDIGHISPPLKAYFDNLTDKSIRILIPGCGKGYEAGYLFEKGFTNVYPLDIADEAKKEFSEKYPGFPIEHWISADFFSVSGQYDLIVEQTFFCAIQPGLRKKYAEKVIRLLKPGGRFIGLLFDDHFEGGPPFGGDKQEYISLFGPLFSSLKMERAIDSIAPRSNRELFVIGIK